MKKLIKVFLAISTFVYGIFVLSISAFAESHYRMPSSKHDSMIFYIFVVCFIIAFTISAIVSVISAKKEKETLDLKIWQAECVNKTLKEATEYLYNQMIKELTDFSNFTEQISNHYLSLTRKHIGYRTQKKSKYYVSQALQEKVEQCRHNHYKMTMIKRYFRQPRHWVYCNHFF